MQLLQMKTTVLQRVFFYRHLHYLMCKLYSHLLKLFFFYLRNVKIVIFAYEF